MNFLQKIGNAMARFMYGRNGADQLSYATLILAIAADVVQAFVRGDWTKRGFGLVSTVLLLVTLWRIFSKNLGKRRAENQKFLEKVWWPLQRKNRDARQRAADKDHKYFTCPTCRTVCRVPKGKGKIVITCPKCGGQIKGKS